MRSVARKIDKLGRIVLPMDFRKALGLDGTAEILLSVEDNVITIRGIGGACRLCGAATGIVDRIGLCAPCIQKIKNI